MKRRLTKRRPVAVITGAHGFIGTALCLALEKKGIRTVAVPREIILDKELLLPFLNLSQPDYIFHLAAYGNHSGQDDDSQTVLVNLAGTLSLLSASLNLPYLAFVNVSTSSVRQPYETFYSATKAAAERLCRAFATKYHKPIVSVRPHSVYGVGEWEHRLTTVAIKSIRTDQIMSLDPTPVHDWIYITDLVAGLLKVAFHAEPLIGQEVELGTGIQTSNQEVVRLIEKIAGKNLLTNPVSNLRPYDSSSWVADMKAITRLGFKPEVMLKEGLRKLYDYYK